MTTLPVTLDRSSADSPRRLQLAAGVREQVLAGTLAPRRPAAQQPRPGRRSRRLALGGRAGLRPAARRGLAGGASRLPGRSSPREALAPVPATTPRTGPERRSLVRLDTGTPWIDPRHAAGWRRAWREVSAATPPRGYDDSRGMPELREALAEHLARTRGLRRRPEEIVVTNGTTDGLRHLLGAVPPGAVGVEDPGYRAAVETVVAAGRPVDDHPALTPITDLTDGWPPYVTPAHQHPLGRVMPAEDRLGLLEAARRGRRRGGRGRLRLGVPLRRGAGARRWPPSTAPGWPTSAPPPSRRAEPPARLDGAAAGLLRPRSTSGARRPTRSRRGRCSAPSCRCCATATSTRWCAPPAASTPTGRPRVAAALSPYAELGRTARRDVLDLADARARRRTRAPGGRGPPASRSRCSPTTAGPPA